MKKSIFRLKKMKFLEYRTEITS